MPSRAIASDVAEVRELVERNMKCLVKATGKTVTHSPSGCPRCQALAALDRIEAAR